MSEKLMMMRRWYQFVKPNRKYFLFCLLMKIGSILCLLLEPIFLSLLFDSLIKESYFNSYFFLACSFLFLFVWKLLELFISNSHVKLIETSYLTLQTRIFDYMVQTTNQDFTDEIKQKQLNIFEKDSYKIADFSFSLINHLALLIIFLVLLGTIYFFSISLGVITTIFLVLSYHIYHVIHQRFTRQNKHVLKSTQMIHQSSLEVMNGKEIIADLNIQTQVQQTYLMKHKTYLQKKDSCYQESAKIHHSFSILKAFFLYTIFFFLIFLVSKRQLNLSIALILLFYIYFIIEKIKKINLFMDEIKEMSAIINQIQLILESPIQQPFLFGENQNDDILGKLRFYQMSHESTDGTHISLHNIDFSIQPHQIILFQGDKNCGKRTIFDLLRRVITPSEGTIYLDGIHLMDYTKNIYRSNVNYLTTNPFFFQGSIQKNLQMVEPMMEEVTRICQQLGIHDYISSLPWKYHTSITSTETMIPLGKKYLIGLARTLLTKSEVIILYEFPRTLSKSEKEKMKETLQDLKRERTILIFSAGNDCLDIADQVFLLEKGTLSVKKKDQI